MPSLLEIISHPLAIIIISGVPSFFVGRWLEVNKSRRSSDTATYQNLNKHLPTFNSIKYFFKENTFTDPFSTKILHDFGLAFEGAVDDPVNSFLNKKLQKDVVAIVKLYRDMAHLVAQETFPTPNSQEQTIRRIKFGDSIDDMATGERLNKQASEIYETFTDFLKKIKSDLHISPN